MAGRDITEGRPTRAIAVELGIGTGTLWQNTDVFYDVAIAGVPFLLAEKDQTPYQRATAPFRKQQFDSQRDPGEQSLTGWWLRSQSSFHAGAGIEFFDPFANPYSTTLATNSYRVRDSYGVNLWEPGQVTLLRRSVQNHEVTTPVAANGRPRQRLFSATWSDTSATYQGFILHDGYDLDRFKADGTFEHWVDYNTGTADPVYAATTDGKTMYWVTNDTVSGKLRMEKKDIAAATSVSPTTMFTHPTGETVTNASIAYVKQRIVLAANNKIYEFPTTQSTMPTPIYTHPSTSYIFSSITESGTAIYVSGYQGIKSSIFKFTLDTATGAMPTLSSAITAAELPIGEVVTRIFTYLGYMMIGTSKGVRVATISDQDGSLTYGPLLFETQHPVYDFAARDRFVWCATGPEVEATTQPGLIRIDLSTEISNLVFAWAKDVHYDTVADYVTTSCAFIGETDRIAYCTAAPSTSVTGFVYMESATELITDGWIDTGYIRYNTLEQKNFKRIAGQGTFDYGSMSVQTVDLEGNIYEVNSYDSVIGNPESTITQPIGAQDAIALRFHLYRDAVDNTKGPVFKGYQLKAVPASPRNRLITIPLQCYDTETDKYNITTGYEGRAIDRLLALEAAEESGDVVTFQDFRTGETKQCLIEEIEFTDTTPPDKRLTGFGGNIKLTIRTV